MRVILGLVVLAPLCALGCGDDTGSTPTDGSTIDSPRPVDGSTIDGPPGGVDAPPARFSDAGTYTTPTTPNSVLCPMLGNQSNACTTPADDCCGSNALNLSCTSAGVDGGACSQFDEACDGTEDCSGSQVCCGSMTGLEIRSACASSCGSGQVQLCHNHTQCPQGMVCCTGTYMNFMLWFGGCVPPAMAPSGSDCDF
jgi:hypothetical protein